MKVQEENMKNSDFRVSSYLCECKQNKRTIDKGVKTSNKNIIFIYRNKGKYQKTRFHNLR